LLKHLLLSFYESINRSNTCVDIVLLLVKTDQISFIHPYLNPLRGRYGRMVVGFTTTYEISAYHNWRCEFESSTWRGVLDTLLGYKVCYWLAAGRWLDRLPKHFKSIICDLQLHTRSPYHKNSDFSIIYSIYYRFVLGYFCRYLKKMVKLIITMYNYMLKYLRRLCLLVEVKILVRNTI
jgi:hypothetical protein